MFKFKEIYGKVNIILIIVIVIIILAGILALKITGVIKPSEKKPAINENNTTISGSKYNHYTTDKKPIKVDITNNNVYSKNKQKSSLGTNIISLIISIALTIGTCKLFIKLGIPRNVIIFNFLSPILNNLANLTSGNINTILVLSGGIMSIVTMIYYYKSVGMPGFLGALLPVSMLMLSFGVVMMVIGGNMFFAMLAIIIFIVSIITYIISNIKLARLFNKGIVFTIGLVVLPFIFQPILGYSNSEI